MKIEIRDKDSERIKDVAAGEVFKNGNDYFIRTATEQGNGILCVSLDDGLVHRVVESLRVKVCESAILLISDE